jgi:flagellar motor switch protein FliM
MDKILSQEEINALFSAMSSEEAGMDGRSEQAPAAPPISRHEHPRVDTIPQDRMLGSKYDQKRKPRRPKTGNHEAKQLYELIRTISVPVCGEIPNSSLTLVDLLKVSEGDIIELDVRIDDPVYLCIGGIAVFKGRIIQRGGKRAFEISDRFIDEPSLK